MQKQDVAPRAQEKHLPWGLILMTLFFVLSLVGPMLYQFLKKL